MMKESLNHKNLENSLENWNISKGKDSTDIQENISRIINSNSFEKSPIQADWLI